MFCKKCGKEIDDEAVVCVHCGCAVEETKVNKEDNEPKKGMGVLMALLLGLIGLIIGLCLYKSGTIARKTFIKAWCITYGICLAITIISCIVYFSLIFGALGL